MRSFGTEEVIAVPALAGPLQVQRIFKVISMRGAMAVIFNAHGRNASFNRRRQGQRCRWESVEESGKSWEGGRVQHWIPIKNAKRMTGAVYCPWLLYAGWVSRTTKQSIHLRQTAKKRRGLAFQVQVAEERRDHSDDISTPSHGYRKASTPCCL